MFNLVVLANQGWSDRHATDAVGDPDGLHNLGSFYNVNA
jgi:hypothetical protein